MIRCRKYFAPFFEMRPLFLIIVDVIMLRWYWDHIFFEPTQFWNKIKQLFTPRFIVQFWNRFRHLFLKNARPKKHSRFLIIFRCVKYYWIVLILCIALLATFFWYVWLLSANAPDENDYTRPAKFFRVSKEYVPHLNIQHSDLVSTAPSDTITRYYLDHNIKKCERLEHYKGLGLKGRNLRYAKFQHSNLFKARLDNTDFTYARLTKTEWHGASMKNASFHLSFMNEAILDNVNISGSDFYSAKMENVTISNSNPVGISFIKTTLEKSTIKNCNFTNADFWGSEMSKVDIFMSDLKNPKFRNTMLIESNMKNITFTRSKFYDNTQINDSSFLYCDLEKTIIQSSNLGDTNFTCCNLKNSNFLNNNMKETTFRACSLAKASFAELTALTSSSFQGSDLSESVFNNITIDDSQFNGANMAKVNIIKTNISSCDFQGANLINIYMSHENFSNCNFNGAVVSGQLESYIDNQSCVLKADTQEFINCEKKDFIDIRNRLACQNPFQAFGILEQYRDPTFTIKQLLTDPDNSLSPEDSLNEFMQKHCPEILKEVWRIEQWKEVH